MNEETQNSLEAKIINYMDMANSATVLAENKKTVKAAIGKMMTDAGETEVRVRWDDKFDIKAKVSTSRRKVLDDAKLAEDLGVAKSAVTERGFLIKAVQEGRLTLEQYESYFYMEDVENVTCRRVKA